MERASEIVDGAVSGGATTSQTITIAALKTLLDAVPAHAAAEDYERAILEDNVLAKGTLEVRRRLHRYLRELYLLRPDALLFRALRDLWRDDPEAQPLLAGLCALARDAVFRSTAAVITGSSPGETLTASDLALAVEEQFGDSYGAGTIAKVGRNTFSSWDQTGHLEPGDRSEKVRTRAVSRPANAAYALLLGHLEGHRGEALYDTLWAQVLDVPRAHLPDLAFAASQRGMLEFRHSGGVTEIGFRELLRPIEGQLL